ncbi:endo alpha-1,4 polygalactosaminidase [Campylobacter sp.]|uniref:endo alpha-1,4 polygalactosaminidase n=1 Tax=Campylobacter sp. TaxID=205 RepID=UPI002708DB26|nr:endo alpha-1,4 polygalactosaminidase [Campylobacter sp.]
MRKILSALVAIFLLCFCAVANENQAGEVKSAIDYREEMRRFVIAISQYGKKFDKNFIVIPQNGLELITKDGSASGELQQGYLRAISAVGIESLFYGYLGDDKHTPADTSEYTLRLCRLYAQNGVQALVTDYCYSASNVSASYRHNKENGFLSFAADKRALTAIPKYPNVAYNVNGNDIKTVWDAKNFLYLINSEKFSTKRQFIDTVKNTDYDIIIMDLFHFEKAYTSAEIRELKTKRNGGKRLVICYMSIGEAEDYRYYWSDAWKTEKPVWLTEENPYWKGNYVVKYWDPDWQKIITGNDESYQRKILDAGFDGVYLDIIDAFEYFEEINKNK